MKFLIIVICLFISGCASVTKMTEGEREITRIIEHDDYIIDIKNWPSLAPIIGGKPAEGILNVKYNNRLRTLRKTNFRFYFVKSLDLTVDYEDDLVFYSWSGGAHGACELIVFDSKISKFHIFYYGGQLGPRNEYLRTFFEGDIPYTFRDMDDDGIPEILILHQWGYYGNSFVFSPQYLKIYSLQSSKVRDVTENFTDFISEVVLREEETFERYRKKIDMTDEIHALNISVLLMKLYGGLAEDSAWRRYNAVREEIGHGERYTREHIEKDMIKYNERFKPYTEKNVISSEM